MVYYTPKDAHVNRSECCTRKQRRRRSRAYLIISATSMYVYALPYGSLWCEGCIRISYKACQVRQLFR
ncbi:hypothetical protein DAEQUDRAFT_726554 [Daedalea quercina L-15889]|uniref:Uncharacterized protein n=1 Tax=Daedalea quercina L-15889 TaxID=1314783 RepID=A0A165QJW8_9APHY|nr:hypothetical protein DAEQUDRAFT_726554 [Daedalea quercina L-15889]